MKKNIHLLFILCLLLLNCSVLDELTKFDIDYEIEYTIPPVSIINIPISLNTPDIETENETTFENNNTNKNSIESIRLKSLTLNITDPETANFNFLKDIRIYIKTENVEETEIANLIDIENSNSRVLELKTLNKELEDYVKEDQFTLRVVAVADETTSEQISITIKSVFAVDAKILGIYFKKLNKMPGLDRTGPEGQGSQTGRKHGKCNTENDTLIEDRSTRFGRGLGRKLRNRVEINDEQN